MARRSDHSRDEIRRMALAAAEAIVDAEGRAGLTARKVASSIGYTVGTLYLVFRNLDDLMVQVNARTLDALGETMREQSARCQTPASCVRALGRAYIDFAEAHPQRWALLYEHRLPAGEAVPEDYALRVRGLFELVEQALAPLADPADSQRLAQAAQVLWGGVHGICVLSLTRKLGVAGKVSAEALADSLIDNYLRGWRHG